MALDFPPGTPGATYTGPNGVIWSWDGAKWISGTGTTVYAPITDPVFLGNPQAPQPAAGDADASIATTAFVTNAVATSLHDVGRNYLHNSMMNVRQRGNGPWTASATLTADRWQLGTIGGSPLSVTTYQLNDGARAGIGDEAATWALGNTFTGGAGASDECFIEQHIEDIRRLAGKTVTLSFWAVASTAGMKLGTMPYQVFGAGGSPSATVVVAGQAVTLTAAYARYSLTFAIPSVSGKTFGTNAGTDYLSIRLAFTAGSGNSANYGGLPVQSGTINIWGVQLELGTVATPLEKLDPVTQLQQCQRFYQAGQVGATQYATAGAGLYISAVFPVTMRAIPNFATAQNNSAGVGAITYANLGGAGPVGTGFGYGVTVLANITATGNCSINVNFTASADL